MINIVIGIRLGGIGYNHLNFLNSSIKFPFKNRESQFIVKSNEIDPDLIDYESSDSESSEHVSLLNEDELKMINEYVENIKSGVYGPEQQKEFEKLNREEGERIKEDSKVNVRELLNTKNEELDNQLKEVFDLSNLPSGEGKSIEWDELEKKMIEQGRTEGISVEELKTMVHSMYHKKGLLNENFKVLEVEGIKLNWRESLDGMEIWFVVDSETRKKDYDIKFLPSRLIIKKRDEVVLDKELKGKVDCDGCFWTMYKNPSTGAKYVNINLTKRSPKFNNMWDQPFV